eukprot:gnl/TRDRNA2_/TRDRNA2_28948_c0_seq1.p1 gnl/TRDRNA2_/TRDRNA2_28948_c0~~gnl/TRDRNA2_/TRDRNA2_28948_c0_seq1.p1  ORF type:complete len:336 (+),score=44.29 gnl/TRDRNA2_/TRDRNA2_28948_c0_seq1:70-1077(+)
MDRRLSADCPRTVREFRPDGDEPCEDEPHGFALGTAAKPRPAPRPQDESFQPVHTLAEWLLIDEQPLLKATRAPPGYVLEHRVGVGRVLHHEPSGILIWAFALDASDAPEHGGDVHFHYFASALLRDVVRELHPGGTGVVRLKDAESAVGPEPADLLGTTALAGGAGCQLACLALRVPGPGGRVATRGSPRSPVGRGRGRSPARTPSRERQRPPGSLTPEAGSRGRSSARNRSSSDRSQSREKVIDTASAGKKVAFSEDPAEKHEVASAKPTYRQKASRTLPVAYTNKGDVAAIAAAAAPAKPAGQFTMRLKEEGVSVTRWDARRGAWLAPRDDP